MTVPGRNIYEVPQMSCLTIQPRCAQPCLKDCPGFVLNRDKDAAARTGNTLSTPCTHPFPALRLPKG